MKIMYQLGRAVNAHDFSAVVPGSNTDDFSSIVLKITKLQ